ncbi:tRNA 2-thiouridine(34) synthase MnmA [Eubacteriaceae bacterium ES2]|nr:tRNA 2-thiouridine(34) synthase MnmA [Eubacteriaceae bacterium ES2]
MANKKVLLGMSGGIDSTCSAVRLKKQGYQVIGISFDFLGNPLLGQDVTAIARTMGIEHYFIDCQQGFEDQVITPFLENYQRGQTPNPCLICNQRMKFPLLFKWAKKLGCDWIATGHYARLEKNGQQTSLLKSRDLNKDQSYFLYHLSQEELSRLRLPLEDFSDKEAVRKVIEKDFPQIARGSESQGICFIPENNHVRFLKERCLGTGPARKGAFVDLQGNRLGAHRGALGYTLGQAVMIADKHGSRELFVCAVDLDRNWVILGQNEDLYKQTIMVSDIKLSGMSLEELHKERDLTFKICCKGESYHGRAEWVNSDQERAKSLRVIARTSFRAPAGGQALVIYKGERLVGGGLICQG